LFLNLPKLKYLLTRFKNPRADITSAKEDKMTEAYCVKCKKKVEMKDAKETKTKKGTVMMKGKCPTCGTTVCRIGSK